MKRYKTLDDKKTIQYTARLQVIKFKLKVYAWKTDIWHYFVIILTKKKHPILTQVPSLTIQIRNSKISLDFKLENHPQIRQSLHSPLVSRHFVLRAKKAWVERRFEARDAQAWVLVFILSPWRHFFSKSKMASLFAPSPFSSPVGQRIGTLNLNPSYLRNSQ
jgi:hypothetical protein